MLNPTIDPQNSAEDVVSILKACGGGSISAAAIAERRKHPSTTTAEAMRILDKLTVAHQVHRYFRPGGRTLYSMDASVDAKRAVEIALADPVLAPIPQPIDTLAPTGRAWEAPPREPERKADRPAAAQSEAAAAAAAERKSMQRKMVLEALRANPGGNGKGIALKVGFSQPLVSKHLLDLVATGEVVRSGHGSKMQHWLKGMRPASPAKAAKTVMTQGADVQRDRCEITEPVARVLEPRSGAADQAPSAPELEELRRKAAAYDSLMAELLRLTQADMQRMVA